MAELDTEQLVHDIEEYGWHVLQVTGEEGEPDYCYSVGFYHSFDQPEVAIFGLPHEVAHELINLIGEDLVLGKAIAPASYLSDIIEGYDCYLLEVDGQFYEPYFEYALWFYQGDEFPIAQCLYPADDGSYPWEWSEEDQKFQPLLGDVD